MVCTIHKGEEEEATVTVTTEEISMEEVEEVVHSTATTEEEVQVAIGGEDQTHNQIQGMKEEE